MVKKVGYRPVYLKDEKTGKQKVYQVPKDLEITISFPKDGNYNEEVSRTIGGNTGKNTFLVKDGDPHSDMLKVAFNYFSGNDNVIDEKDNHINENKLMRDKNIPDNWSVDWLDPDTPNVFIEKGEGSIGFSKGDHVLTDFSVTFSRNK